MEQLIQPSIVGIFIISHLIGSWILGRIAHSNKFGRCMWDAIIYTYLTYKCYTIIYKEPFVPPSMGGSGQINDLMWDHPTSYNVLRFYQVQFAFHIAETFILFVFSFRKQIFLEMFIHHILTLALVSYSYYNDYTNPGILLIFLHNLTDIPISFGKALTETNCDTLQIITYLVMVFSWAYYRLYLFGTVILASHYKRALIDNTTLFAISGVFLTILLSMHIYWFCLIIRIGYRKLVGHRFDDLHDSTTSPYKSSKRERPPRRHKPGYKKRHRVYFGQ